MHRPDPADLNRDDFSATYCPEDNKIRLYTDRLERETFLWLRSLKFTATPKQDCSFVATWSPLAEDAALMLIAEGDDIGDEDQSPEDRAADRAERFSMYREKRRAEAHGLADRYDAGPNAYGHQNAARAERLAARRDRIGRNACSQWSKAEYWQIRTAGVISHALYKSSPEVRRSRILRLEAEQRKHLATIAEAQQRYDAWQEVLNLPDADNALTFSEDGRKYGADSVAVRKAYILANSGTWGLNYKHPRTGRESSLYSHMTNSRDPITAREAATLAIGNRQRPERGRWADHYDLRLSYERQMLESEGGSAGNVEMQPGGKVGKYLILKVHKSPATGAVVSVTVSTPGAEVWGKQVDRQRINIQRFGESVYTPPTPETLAELETITSETKARTQARNAKAPKLINPTPEDAQRLQDALNAAAKDRQADSYTARDFQPTAVTSMTQDEYSTRSKGTHSRYKTQYLHQTPSGFLVLDNRLSPIRGGEHVKGWQPICKVRTAPRVEFYSPESVVVITDKPQKPLPDWTAQSADETQTEPAATA